MTSATDKHGNELSPGDHVELVYGGEQHVMRIEALSQDRVSRLHQVHGTVTAVVPAGAVKRVESPVEAMPAAHRRTTRRDTSSKEN